MFVIGFLLGITTAELWERYLKAVVKALFHKLASAVFGITQ